MGNPTINFFHNDNWKIEFSNIPTENPNEKINPQYFNLFVKSVALPDFQLELDFVKYRNFAERQVVYNGNEGFQQMSIEFKVSEDMKNYFILYKYILATRWGKKFDKNQWLKDNTIKTIFVYAMDNQKRIVGGLEFTNAILTGLGALSFQTGATDSVTFAATFMYEDVKPIEKK